MNILGIIFQEGFGHPAACLLQNGKLIAWAEEERFVRVKQARGYFPGESIRYCLKAGGIKLDEVDEIAFGWDARKYRWRYPLFLAGSFLKTRRLHWPRISRLKQRKTSLGSAWISGMKDLLNTHPRHLREQLILGFQAAGLLETRMPPIRYVPHHLAHAASAFFCSGWDEAAVLVYDGHGEEDTISIWKGKGLNISRIARQVIPHSLGWFYSIFTEYLGWNPHEGEVKLMGLAPYGAPDEALQQLMEEVLPFHAEGIRLNSRFSFYHARSRGRFYSDELTARLGPARRRDEPITSFHRNLAWAVQQRLEAAGLHLARLALSKTQQSNLCLAGGVALNCKLNGKLWQEAGVENLFVQPVSYDAGVALGAAMIAAQEKGQDPRMKLQHLYWGPSFEDAEIESILNRNRINFRKSTQIAHETAQYLVDGKLIAWFQGRMEVGPRALGHRSILADPRQAITADKVNESVKFREHWRPFALSLLAEYQDQVLIKACDAPFMVMAFETIEATRKNFAATRHSADQSTRPQTVHAHTSPRFHALLTAFHALSGVPGLLNTSFNIKGEPIVCSPEDALRCFYGTGLDVLVMGNYVIEK